MTFTRGKKTVLSPEEVCSIIKACSLGDVTELKFRDLSLKREPTALRLASNLYPVAEITESQHNEQTKRSVEAEEFKIREDQIRELAISDPLAYEQMLQNGELEGIDDDGDDATDLSSD